MEKNLGLMKHIIISKVKNSNQ